MTTILQSPGRAHAEKVKTKAKITQKQCVDLPNVKNKMGTTKLYSK